MTVTPRQPVPRDLHAVALEATQWRRIKGRARALMRRYAGTQQAMFAKWLYGVLAAELCGRQARSRVEVILPMATIRWMQTVMEQSGAAGLCGLSRQIESQLERG